MDLLKNPRAFLRFHHFLGFLGIFLYRKKSWIGYVDHGRLSVHGGFTTMARARPLRGSGGHRDSSKREREREDIVGVLTNVASWSLSCGDGHTTVLNRGGRWFSDWEMVPGVRRYWSRGGCSG
jgi:hypothetical protein